jgi:hypothetical protein
VGSAPSLARLNQALRATSGSKVHTTTGIPRARAQARWWTLSANPTPRCWPPGATPVMWEWRARSGGAVKNPALAPTIRVPAKAPTT